MSRSWAAAFRAFHLGVYSALTDEVSLHVGPDHHSGDPLADLGKSFLFPVALHRPCSKPPGVTGE